MESPVDEDLPDMLRRTSLAGEPLIVVEETGGIREEEGEEEDEDTGTAPESPMHNPYLLSPYRDLRKRSLPTPPCMSGITASQVRRLSEQGGEGGKGPSPMEAAFLATLSQAPAPSTGRRHSVVTISRVPPTSLFGRNRRESIAAFSRFPRKDSTPSLAGSSFNLQLDIMDDIAEIKKARKVKLKMWQTENEEKVCEVSEGGSVARYHQKETRRFSDVTGIPPLREQMKRRASHVPPTGPGIVCSNTDLQTIMSSLTSSAQEIQTPPHDRQSPTDTAPPEPCVVLPVPATPTGSSSKVEDKPPIPAVPPPQLLPKLEEKRNRLKKNRSNSFDVSLMPKAAGGVAAEKNWFLRRHLPMEGKGLDRKPGGSLKEKLVWDKPSGSVVDPQVLGSAIEAILTKRTSSTEQPPDEKNWQDPKEQEEEVSCDNSLCATLKDLFVK